MTLPTTRTGDMGKDVSWTKEIVPNGGIDETRSPTQTEDHKWTAASNVEPLPDGVRTRQGINKSNTVALQEISLEFDQGTDDREFEDGASEYISQGFTVGASDIDVSRVAVRIKNLTGTPTGDVDVAIYADSVGTPGEPGVVVTGLDFAQFSNITDAAITGEYLWHFFAVATGVTLTATDVFHLVVYHANAASTGTDNYGIEEVSTPSGYAGGKVNYATTLGSWTDVAAADLNFRVYAGVGAITGIHDYWLSDGQTQRHILTHDREVYKNSAGTITQVSGRLRESFTASANTFPSFAVGQDRLLIAHGSDMPTKFNVLAGVEGYSNQGLAPPTVDPSLAVSNTGGSLTVDHEFFVDYYYWNDDLAIRSNSRYQGISALSVSTSGTDLTLDITGLPAEVAREGDSATHLRVMLRDHTAGETVWTYQQQVALGTTSVKVLTRNIGTEGEYVHNVPPTHSINCVAANRQFVGGDSTYPWRLWYSLIVGAVSYYESFPTTSFRDFGQGDADYITALLFIPPRHVMVGMKNSIWIIDANRPGTSDAIRVSSGVGIAHHNAATVVGRTVFFVSDGDRSKGMYTWAGGGEPQPLFGVDDTFKALNQGRLQYASCAHYAPGDNRFQWWTLLSSGSTGDRILMYDYALKSWTVYKTAGNVLGEIEVSNIERLFLGGYDGFERLADDGPQDDSTDITSTFTMKSYDFGSQEVRKRMRFSDYVALGKSAGSINVSLDFDFGTGLGTTATYDHIADTNIGTWGAAGGDKWETGLRGDRLPLTSLVESGSLE